MMAAMAKPKLPAVDERTVLWKSKATADNVQRWALLEHRAVFEEDFDDENFVWLRRLAMAASGDVERETWPIPRALQHLAEVKEMRARIREKLDALRRAALDLQALYLATAGATEGDMEIAFELDVAGVSRVLKALPAELLSDAPPPWRATRPTDGRAFLASIAVSHYGMDLTDRELAVISLACGNFSDTAKTVGQAFTREKDTFRKMRAARGNGVST